MMMQEGRREKRKENVGLMCCREEGKEKSGKRLMKI